MPVKLDAPIPGQSLTMEPGNAPWEQPPLYADTQQALAFHLTKFEDEETLDDVMFLLEQGFPLSSFVESIMTAAQMEGVHTVDVSVLIAPVVHEYLLTLAQAADIEVVETDGPTKEERMQERDKKRFMIMLQKALEQSGGESDVLEEMMGTMNTTPPEPDTEETISEPTPRPRGLISRRA